MGLAHAALLRAASGEAGEEPGVVRLAASEIAGIEILPELLSTFSARNRGITIELALSNRVSDLLRREADIAVRMARPNQSSLIARRAGLSAIGLYAHRDYVELCGLPGSLDDMAGHRLIGFDKDDHSFRSVGQAPRHLSREHFGFRADSDIAQLAALRAGIGIGGCQRIIAARDPDLVPVLEREVELALEVWVVMHESLKHTRRIRLLFNHLSEGLRQLLRGP
jgi:DNA-binding transcriptional LysR family regulator